MSLRILVTGASSGIGEASAIALAAPDRHLVLTARRVSALEAVAEKCRTLGATAEVVPADLGDPESVERPLAALRAALGTPVLVNNAGLAHFGDFAQTPWEHVNEELTVNLVSPTRLAHGFVPIALEAGGGHLVNILSITSELVFPRTAGYSAAKSGLRMLGKVLATEYRRKGLRVTSILPGAVDTPIWDGMTGGPKRSDMIPVHAIAEAVRDIVLLPRDRNVDELVLMPPNGVL